MPTADQSRQALALITTAAVTEAQPLLAQPADLLDGLPALVGYYSDGTAALAADYYDDARELASPRGLYVAEPVVNLRDDKIRIGAAWALKGADLLEQQERLAEVVQLETARPYRDTITVNRRRDPAAVGWRRVTSGGCKFCRMLADRGAVYKDDSAHFASHPHCHCGAEPVFKGTREAAGPEASVMQYVASRRRRTPAQRQALREFLAAMPD